MAELGFEPRLPVTVYEYIIMLRPALWSLPCRTRNMKNGALDPIWICRFISKKKDPFCLVFIFKSTVRLGKL